MKDAATQALSNVQALIEAQKLKTQMQIDAVFGEDSQEGADLSEQFKGYFSGLDADASAVGKELMSQIGAAMADGIMTSDEQAAINKLAAQMQNIKTQAMLQASSGEIAVMALNAREGGLSADSLTALLSGTSDKIQEGVQTIQTSATRARRGCRHGAGSGWSQDRITSQDQGIVAASAQKEAAYVAQQYTTVWNAVGDQINASFASGIQTVQEKLPDVVQKAQKQAFNWADMMGFDRNDEAVYYQLVDNIRMGLGDIDWSSAVDDDTRSAAQSMYELLEPSEQTLNDLAKTMGDSLPSGLQGSAGYHQPAEAPLHG